MKRTFKIFTDFDGTVTTEDIGDSIFREFGERGKVDKIIEDLLNDYISSRECWERLCEITGFVDKEKLDEFIMSREVEPTFFPFVNYCRENDHDLFIISDGFDYYINKILEKNKLDEIKVFANSLSVNADGKLIPSFPYYDERFPVSANCKGKHIINNSSDEDYTVFIGDGNSDREPVQFVDFIFAKDSLLKYCEMNRITFFPFKNYNDVIFKLEELSSKKKLKKRHQAELKRREVYMAE